MSFPSGLRIRPAQPSDHAAFVRLFPELAVEDPVMTAEKFTRELVPTTLIAEAVAAENDGPRVVGYAYFQLLKDLAYVRHIVTAPEARETGVGRALMAAIVDRARAADCTTWCLNVKRENTAALGLYEKVGLAPAYSTKALRLTWTNVDAARDAGAEIANRMQHTRLTARLIEPRDDAHVESALSFVSGQLALLRGLGGRVLMGLFDGDDAVAATAFDPTFPGAYPFRAARPDLAFALLRAIRPHARPSDDHVKVVSEGEPAIADALLAAGATLVHDIVHMKGALPAA
jgi:ribosomal protein S18 acetylase RimI-like enzyme